MEKGLIMTHGKHHVIMLTNSKKTKAVLCKFVKENPDINEAAKSEIIGKLDLYADTIRKMIECCTVEKFDSHYRIVVGKSNRLNAVLNYPIAESSKLVFIEEV